MRQPNRSETLVARGNESKIRTAVVAALVTLGGAASANAANAVWVGNSSTNFETGGNWSGGTGTGGIPAVAQIGEFNTAGTYQPQVTASRTLGGILFDTGGWTIGSSSATNILTVGGGITSAASASNAISANINFGANSPTWLAGAGGTLSISGAISDSGNRTLTLGSATSAGSGTIVLSGANTYTSATTIAGGTVQLGAGGTLGDASNALSLSSGATLDLHDVNVTTGAASSSGTILNNGSGTATFTFGNSSGTTIAGTLADNSNSGSGKLAIYRNGAGQIAITGNNTYSGGTTLAGSGDTRISSATALGSGAVTLSSGYIHFITNSFTFANNFIVNGASKLQFDAATTILSGAFTGSGSLQMFGNLGGAFSGDLSAFQGTLDFENNVSGGKLFSVSYANGSGVSGSSSANFNLATAVTNRNTVQWTGTGSTTFAIGGLTGSGSAVLQNGTSSSTATFQVGALGTDTTFAGIVQNGSGTAALEKVGAGTLTLTGGNTYTGATIISGGVLLENLVGVASTTGTGTTGSGSQTITGVSTAGLVVTQGISGLNLKAGTTITGISGSTITISQQTNSGATTGTLTFAAVNNTLGGLGASGGGSNIQLNGGVLGLGAVGNFSRGLGTGVSQVQFTNSGGFAAFDATRTVNLGGAETGVIWASTTGFLGNGKSLILGASAANATVDFQNGIDTNGALRTVQADNGSAAVDGILSGAITGGGGINKTGAGTLQLTNSSNGYTGNTVVQAGTLSLAAANNNIASSSKILVGDVAANSAAKLDVSGVSGGFHVAASQTLGGYGTVVGNTTVDGTLSPGGSIGTLTLAGNTAFGDGSNFLVEISGASADQLQVTGNLDLSSLSDKVTVVGTPLANTVYVIATYTGTLSGTFDNTALPTGYSIGYDTPGAITLQAVPEPAMIGIVGTGILMMTARRRRQS